MSYKTIMVCLTISDNADRLMKVATNVARMFDAHLIGLHTLQSISVYPGITVPIPTSVTDRFRNEQLAEAEKIKKIFLDETKPEDFVSEWRCVEARSVTAGDRIAEHARCTDLIIMAQPDKEHDRVDQGTIQRQVIETSGRPVLIIPTFGNFEKIGTNTLIGWSATKEATRSVHDAIPFMQKGKSANVFWVTRGNSIDSYEKHTAHEIATVLDRYDIKVNVSHGVNAKLAIGDIILNEASNTGADLIVTGAYGHSRVYDFMVGATTSHLMKYMTVPVLFSC